ncbi:MAG: M50 family metallopeptidase [Chloroflexota bacterium]
MLLTFLGVAVVIGLVLFVHELGHFVAAKRFGIVVEEFGFGFPPRLVRFWRDRAAIYVAGQKLLIDRKASIPEGLKSQCSVRYQTAVDAKGRLLVVDIEVVDPQEAPDAVYVAKFDPGTEYTLNLIPFLAFVRMLGEENPQMPGSLASASKRARFVTLFGGPAMNLLLALALFVVAFMVGWPEASEFGVLVVDVAADSPAQKVGLQVNDVVVSIDGHPVQTAEELKALTDERLGQLMTLEVLRQGEPFLVNLVPRANPPANEGAMGVSIVGEWVTQIEPTRYPLGQAIVRGSLETVGAIVMVVEVPVQILRGLIPVEQARPTGIVGIARMTADAVEQSVDTGWLFPVVQLAAIISIAIGLTNLLPIPAFDGGRLMFVVLEAIRGKRVSPEREGAIHFIGLSVMLALMLVITYYDVTADIPTIDWQSLLPK